MQEAMAMTQQDVEGMLGGYVKKDDLEVRLKAEYMTSENAQKATSIIAGDFLAKTKA